MGLSVLRLSAGLGARPIGVNMADATTTAYATHAHRLRSLIRRRVSRRLRQRCDVDDLLQQAFIRFHVSYRGVPLEEVWPLLAVIATNRIRDEANRNCAAKRDIRRTMPIREEEVPPVPRSDAADMLDCIPATCREALRLRLTGYEAAEIAAQLHVSKRTVERMFHQIRIAFSRIENG